MILYHGSNIEVKNPDLKISTRTRDFGRGFYLTSSLEQATSWAKHRTYQREKVGKPTISIYELNEEGFHNLNVKKFDGANEEWLEYITLNRTSKEIIDDPYDIVIGPVANDSTAPVINLYLSGVISEDIAIENLKTYVLKDQYTIKTEKALSYLKYEGSEYND